MKKRAKELGIWNMFLPKNHFANEGSPGFTNLEYGLMAEQLGKSRIASEACNCAAPDTGNMEVIARYGSVCPCGVENVVTDGWEQYASTKRPMAQAPPRRRDPLRLPHD
jgi:hypothetical protein